jgi:hypothetical protein
MVGHPEVIRRGPPTKAAGVPHGINTPMRHTRGLTDEQCKILGPPIPKQEDDVMTEGGRAIGTPRGELSWDLSPRLICDSAEVYMG